MSRAWPPPPIRRPSARRAPTRLALLAACLAVAGCGMSTRAPPKLAADSTTLGQCQRQAENDPVVKDLLLQNFYISADPQHDQALRMARRKATDTCLRARGVELPGGVEPVQKSGYLL
jgi:hypothetical protein